MAEPLATINDLNARLGRTIAPGSDEESRALALLVDASAAVRSYTGQTVTTATTTERFRVHRHRPIVLSQRPVTAVTAVVNADSVALSYTFDGIDRVEMWSDIGAINASTLRPRLNVADITYIHGYTTVPDDLIAVVCQTTGRALGIALEDSGFTRVDLDGYSEAYGTIGAGGAIAFLPAEREVLDRYGPRAAGSIRVGRR